MVVRGVPAEGGPWPLGGVLLNGVWKASALCSLPSIPQTRPPPHPAVYLHLGPEEAQFPLQLLVFPDQPLQALSIFPTVQGLDQGGLGRNAALLVLPLLRLPTHCRGVTSHGVSV